MIRTDRSFDPGVLHIVLDRPRGNILDTAMVAALRRTLDEEVRPETRLLVFEGAGRHFSFGASVQEHLPGEVEAMLPAFHALFRHLAGISVPTCAVVRGQCLGGGLELAAWCTWVVAHPDARLGQPEIRLGVFPPMASLLLPWRAGGRAALDLCISGRSVSAAEAHRLGVVDVVAEDPTAWWQAHFREHLAPASAAALRLAERAVRSELLERMDRLLPALERLYLEDLVATRDAREGLTAFLERRPARFTHR